jgi:hypothetical protein
MLKGIAHTQVSFEGTNVAIESLGQNSRVEGPEGTGARDQS